MPALTGSITDPDFRRRRAAHAARARTTVDHYIDKLVDEAPPLTPQQRDRLATLLRPGPTKDAA
jgi:hypothetical protein